MLKHSDSILFLYIQAVSLTMLVANAFRVAPGFATDLRSRWGAPTPHHPAARRSGQI